MLTQINLVRIALDSAFFSGGGSVTLSKKNILNIYFKCKYNQNKIGPFKLGNIFSS